MTSEGDNIAQFKTPEAFIVLIALIASMAVRMMESTTVATKTKSHPCTPCGKYGIGLADGFVLAKA